MSGGAFVHLNAIGFGIILNFIPAKPLRYLLAGQTKSKTLSKSSYLT